VQLLKMFSYKENSLNSIRDCNNWQKNHFNALPSSQAQSQKNMSAAPATFVHKLRKAQSGVAVAQLWSRFSDWIGNGWN